MTIQGTPSIRPGDQSVAPPQRTAGVPTGAPDPDRFSKALEEWLVEVKLRYTLGGD